MQAITAKNNKVKEFFIALGFSLGLVGLGFLVGWLGGATKGYTGLVRPAFTPPDWFFSVAWSVLYALMGVSLYLILRSEKSEYKMASLVLFFVQLALNFLWTPVFFNMRAFFWAFVILALCTSATVALVFVNFKVNKASAYLLLPYLAWLLFACYLNISIVALNI